MFWDRIAGVYDVFGKIINGKVNDRVTSFISKRIDFTDNVLECACGTGYMSAKLAEKCRNLTATDYSDGMVKQAYKRCSMLPNVTVKKEDITALEFEDSSFDVVIAANVIHLLDDPDKALSEMQRVCREGGTLIIPTYVNKEKTGKNSKLSNVFDAAGADFKQQFTFRSYCDFFRKKGYTVSESVLVRGTVPCAVVILKNEKQS
ncbi:MAG: class I SAM-dependent methyltransferase [Oscillospiraceae bacterium]|nr:class I SAM-dependent methyltransferase [Oscillospiraceae bacterium]